MKKRVYLSGAMQFADETSASWREQIKPLLLDMGWDVLDPVEKEIKIDFNKILKEYRENNNAEFDVIMKKIQDQDKKMVLMSDLIILQWDVATKSYGTLNELSWAMDKGIPVYSTIIGDIQKESMWALAYLFRTKVFNDMLEIIKEMKAHDNNQGVIYKITNIVNNKKYIGQTHRTLYKRKLQHTSALKREDLFLYRAIRKYGIDNFLWDVVCTCSSARELDDKEKFYMDKFKTYNRE